MGGEAKKEVCMAKEGIGKVDEEVGRIYVY
jgi:hypothetical protein